MDFRHIRAFIAVADALSVTRAAERLHITQPPLTRHIHQLERELGVTLFIRHRQGVTLTQAGLQLLERARKLDAAALEFVSAARHAVRPDAGIVRIGIGWGLWDLVHRVRVEFGRQFPNVAIEATDAFCHLEANAQLKNRTLDLVFARPPYDGGLQVSPPILEEPIQAVVADSSPLARAERVGIRDLARYPLLLWDRHIAPALYDRMLELYARAGVDVPMIPTPGAGPYNHAGLMLVASGTGIYLGYGVPLTAPHAPSGVAVRPLSDPGATMEVCAVCRKDASAIVAQFIETIWRVVPGERLRRFA